MDNNRDARSKGRWSPSRGNRVLNGGDVIAIRARYAKGDVTFKELADESGVNISAINHIVHRRNWKEVR